MKNHKIKSLWLEINKSKTYFFFLKPLTEISGNCYTPTQGWRKRMLTL